MVDTQRDNEEIIPALQKDPGYLDRHNMELVARGSDVTVVDHRSIDWDDVDAENFPYAVRQRPGRSNALGHVKFVLPNNMNIYLHDSPADQLFARTRRAFSHGCIRLARPLELARLILQRSTDPQVETRLAPANPSALDRKL
ncbi:MAG: L,D-transpeptidase family protein [Gammaproteobacteria bacterium]